MKLDRSEKVMVYEKNILFIIALFTGEHYVHEIYGKVWSFLYVVLLLTIHLWLFLFIKEEN